MTLMDTARPELALLDRAVAAAAPERLGRVSSIVGLGLDVVGLELAIGDRIRVLDGAGTSAEVVAVQDGTARCMPLGQLTGVRAGVPVRRTGASLVPVGAGLLGRVIDALGRPLDGKGPLCDVSWVEVDAASPNSMERARISRPVQTGVRVLDTMTTLGRGQRIGLFAGSGVGKSSLLSMVARGTDAAISVIALVGERGREVQEFIQDDLGPEGLARSVVVIATGDEPALLRLRAAFTATRIAEHERSRGEDVVLMMDSLTRVAMAQREIGLSAGEPPATRGYPPSTFSVLARLLERAGTAAIGSITGIYTVLVDGDDHNEPIADAARSILDGHVVLDRRLAVAGQFPAVDVLGSISRVATKVIDPSRAQAARAVRQALAAKRQAQDLIDIGAYHRGSNPLVDIAIELDPELREFLTQRIDESTALDASWQRLEALAERIRGAA